MNLQSLHYFVAVAEHRHFGKAARACSIGQPTLSGQLRKLEEELGVKLFERNNRRVSITPLGEKLLPHARRAIEEANQVEAVARSSQDQLTGPLKLGVIPTLAPYLMPLILGPLRQAYPQLSIELWEDVTATLVDRLRGQRLDAALIATAVPESDLTSVNLFKEPFLAALPVGHRLAAGRSVNEVDLAEELLVLADGHCLAGQASAACARRRQPVAASDLRAASLETLVNLVSAGYGATLVPLLARKDLSMRKVILMRLTGGSARTIRLVSRPAFPRPKVLKALGQVIRERAEAVLTSAV